MTPLPVKLVKQGAKDMLRISDARMSGTSCCACPQNRSLRDRWRLREPVTLSAVRLCVWSLSLLWQ